MHMVWTHRHFYFLVYIIFGVLGHLYLKQALINRDQLFTETRPRG